MSLAARKVRRRHRITVIRDRGIGPGGSRQPLRPPALASGKDIDVAGVRRDRGLGGAAAGGRRGRGGRFWDMHELLASDQVLGTPTLFIDGVVHRGGYDPPALLAALAS